MTPVEEEALLVPVGRAFLRAASIGVPTFALLRLLGLESWGEKAAILAYASPWILLAPLSLLVSGYSWKRAWRWRFWFALAMACVGIFLWAQKGLRLGGGSDSAAASDRVLRVLFWNADHYEQGPWDFDGSIKKLSDFEADLLVLSESDASRGPQKEAFAKHLPNHAYEFAGMDMTYAHREGAARLRPSVQWLHKWSGYAMRMEIDTRAGPLRVICFDQHSDFEADRSGNIQRLAEWADGFEDGKPTLIVGDFNTPAEARALDPLREAGWKRAFEEAGSGLGETWPLPLPVLALDQCWTRDEIRVLSARQVNIKNAGHQAILLEIELPEPSASQLDEEAKASKRTRPGVDPLEESRP